MNPGGLSSIRKNKFKAQRTPCRAGHVHASKREAARCDHLHLLQRGKAITNLVCEPFYPFIINGQQVKHDGGRRVGYKPDFTYMENGAVVAEDVKSVATVTEAFVLRAVIFRALYPAIELRIIT